MPSITVKLYSVLFKFFLKRKLQALLESHTRNPYGVVSRPDEAVAAANPCFSDDGVATKDLHIDPATSLSVRIFLPDSAIISGKSVPDLRVRVPMSRSLKKVSGNGVVYGGYSPDKNGRNCRKLPVILQFHGGGWVSGGSDTVANDVFSRRIAKLCDAVVVAVGYRLAPESRYPAAFDDGVKVLNWLGKQANLAECDRSWANGRVGGGIGGEDGGRRQIVDGFGASMVEPWLAAHADPSRCVLLGASCGANIANYVARRQLKLGPPSWQPFNPVTEVPLKLMPPTLTVVAEHDWMRDRAILYSEELRKAKIDAPLLDYKDTIHEFATLDALLKTPEAQACSEDIAIWVKKYISLRGHEFSY
ncbi:UNVERIFIED_CONTAM: putative carboxylesterase 11 [Sesamum calycinum]|uniref:Carboxylesterase 11 n=1 Tax=Sesamum calycinum TaxID=2727403 RepID=A0AAW2PNT9_9LAMI